MSETEATQSHNEESTTEVDKDHAESTSRFKPGQILKFIRVRFPGHAKAYPFHVGKRNFKYGEKVVAMSDRGMAVGYINSFPYEQAFKEEMLPIRSIKKHAEDADEMRNEEQHAQEKHAEELCTELVKKHKLNMDITHVEYTQFGKKVVFYFIAPARVDFRGLVKDLVSELKLKIELRQISIRDRAAALGGIGPCGRQLCCSSFLGRYGKVSIKMAKNQNLSLIPARLNGLCGQLKCCTSYEDEVYTEKRSALPEENTFVEVKNGDRGRVRKLHILADKFDMITDQGKIRRYHVSMYDKAVKLPKDYRFPDRFDHVANETSTVISAQENEEKPSADNFEDDNIDDFIENSWDEDEIISEDEDETPDDK